MPLQEILRKGAAVSVRCAAGQIRQNVVWEDFGDVVLVCAADQFERLSAGHAAPMPIGFRKADVVKDEGAAG